MAHSPSSGGMKMEQQAQRCFVSPRGAGVALIVLAVLLNHRTLGLLFSPDGAVNNALVRAVILAAESSLAAAGGLLIYYDRRINTAAFGLWIKRLVLAGAACAAVIAGAELFIRFYHPHPVKPDTTHLLFRHHSIYGHEFIPGKTAYASAPYQFRQKITINSHGMRDREYSLAKPAGVRRIAAVGDSFAAGLEVKRQYVFTDRMEEMLGPSWEVLNFGVSGYSPLHELLYFKERILAFAPDLVLLVIYARNDFDEMRGLYYDERRSGPIAAIDRDGGLLARNTPVPVPEHVGREEGPRGWFRITNLHLFNFLQLRFKARERILVNSYPEVRHLNNPPTDHMREDYAILYAVLTEFSRLCSERDVALAVVYAPTILQIYPSKYWNKIRVHQQLDGEYDIDMPNREIGKVAARLQLPYIDLGPPLRAGAVRGESLYFTWNQHWNRSGHRVVSEAILEFLSATFPDLVAPEPAT